MRALKLKVSLCQVCYPLIVRMLVAGVEGDIPRCQTGLLKVGAFELNPSLRYPPLNPAVEPGLLRVNLAIAPSHVSLSST